MAYQCINYLERVGDNAEKVFKEAVALRCRHVSTASWDQMHRDKTINCNGSGAIALQLSMLPVAIAACIAAVYSGLADAIPTTAVLGVAL